MSRRPDNSLSADHTLIVGGTGSGKSSWMLRHLLRGEKRVIAWDGKDELGGVNGFERITSARVLAQRVATGRDMRLAFAGRLDQFRFWAKAAWAYGHCVVIAEELADVTNPAKAPLEWGEVMRKGRGHGLRTISLTQRPAEIDKTTVGNATRAVVGALTFEDDEIYVSKKLKFPLETLRSLDLGDFVDRRYPRGDIAHTRAFPKRGRPKKRA